MNGINQAAHQGAEGTNMATTGLYRVCVRNPELSNQVATGVTIEADSLSHAYEILDALPGMHSAHPRGDRRYTVITTERVSEYDRLGPTAP